MLGLAVAVAVLVSPAPLPQFVPLPAFVPAPQFHESAPVPIWDDASPPTPAEALVEAGRHYFGVRCFDGRQQALLDQLAGEHAAYQARVRRQGHQDFQARYDRIRAALGMAAIEICAESWRHDAGKPVDAIARTQYEAWQQSPGHWSVASTSHAAWGAGMARGSNGIWYATILVADRVRDSPPSPEWAQGVRGGPPGRWEIRTQCTRAGCVRARVWVPE